YPQHKKDCRRDEPPRLPKVRHYREIQRRAALIPASFAVECPDLEAIFPGRQTRVFGVPFRASILPILVETLKAVAKTNVVQAGETQCGKLNFELPVLGR